MTSQDFTHYLRGFLEGKTSLNEQDINHLRAKLSEVYDWQLPLYPTIPTPMEQLPNEYPNPITTPYPHWSPWMTMGKASMGPDGYSFEGYHPDGTTYKHEVKYDKPIEYTCHNVILTDGIMKEFEGFIPQDIPMSC